MLNVILYIYHLKCSPLYRNQLLVATHFQNHLVVYCVRQLVFELIHFVPVLPPHLFETAVVAVKPITHVILIN